ncbi:hypothetical protein KAR91_05160, partial [Candidatus Pacearchaeota archaeon]|nr:hypothetical protein [Candidatus Pacearchaeota archaeon]
MLLDKYTFQQLRDAIEIELQKTDDAKLAAAIAITRLNKDPEYYESMQKARVTKYLSKKPDGKGGWTYTYKDKKINPFKALLDLFSLKREKIDQKYNENKIKETFGVDRVTYASHVLEYFSNKEKWDKIFSEKKEKKSKKKTGGRPGTPGVKKSKKPSSPAKINKELMRSIYNSFNETPAQDIPAEKKEAIDSLPTEKKGVVLSDNFKNWFGDWVNDPENASKVVDNNDIPEEQKPITVFHGTARGGFTEFSKEYQGGGLYGNGFYFTEEEEIAKEYSKSKGTDLADSIASAEKFSANGEEIEYINESKGKKELKELKAIDFKNQNWDPAIISAMEASYEKGKGYNVDKLLSNYNDFQELAGRAKSTTNMGKEKIFKIIKDTFPKSAKVKPIVADPEVFDVYLDIKNPLDLDSDIKTADAFLDDLMKESKQDAIKNIEGKLKKHKEDLKNYIKYHNEEKDKPDYDGRWELDNVRSSFGKIVDGEWEPFSMGYIAKKTDAEVRKMAYDNDYYYNNVSAVHIKHLLDVLPKDAVESWAFKKGYFSTYDNDDGTEEKIVGEGDIPGTKENIYALAEIIAEHGLMTYDHITQTTGRKYIPNTPEGRPTLQHLAHILSDAWSFTGGEKLNDWARSLGHDGLRHTGGWSFTGGDNPKHTVWIVFEPNQIKSATKNKGTFDPKSNDMNKAKDVS